jgi:hypothetical protein
MRSRKNAVESRSLPLLASRAGLLNGDLDSMTEWLSWSCWADWLLVVPVHPSSGPGLPEESSVSRASDARCALLGLSSGGCRPAYFTVGQCDFAQGLLCCMDMQEG